MVGTCAVLEKVQAALNAWYDVHHDPYAHPYRILMCPSDALLLADELDRCHRNITQTAKALGLERSHLYKKCQQLGIDLQSLPEREG